MPSWAERQARLRDFVLDRTDVGDLAADLAEPPAPPDALSRLAIHRNCTQIGLADSLADAFPVLRRLVGEDFFAAQARAYVRAHPPQTASLLFYGGGMASFMRDWPPLAAMPWLADVAHLESVWAQAYHAADADALNPADLFALPPDMLSRLILIPHPSLRLLASPWPVADIWHANQPDSVDQSVSLDSGPQRIMLCRPGPTVTVHPLTEGAFSFLLAVQMAQPLETAWESALQSQPDFDLGDVLATLLHHGCFQGYDLP